MRGFRLNSDRLGSVFALLLVACALLLRVAIPGGWMPAKGADGLVRITLCTGMGAVEAWVDGQGRIHDGAPTKQRDPKTDQPCAFAGLIAPAIDADPLPPPPVPVTRGRTIAFTDHAVAIGQGLAAPPPPPTGPPVTL